jgi:hypothetical protein
MANIKEVYIEVEVPFDWTSKLTGEEAQVWMAWVHSPSTGLHVDYGRSRLGPKNDRGGHSTLYPMRVEGREAIRSLPLAMLMDSLRKQQDVLVTDAMWRDVQWGEDDDWCLIETVEENKEAEKRVKEMVDEQLKDTRIVGRQHGQGVSESMWIHKDAPLPDGWSEMEEMRKWDL